MSKYAQHLSATSTPQTEPIPGREKDQAENSAGGYSFVIDDWARLDRFLILGCEGGTYYATERKLTIENAIVLQKCAILDAKRTVDRIVYLSQSGRVAKNSTCIFSMAVLASRKDVVGLRSVALRALPLVCRTGSHLLEFVSMYESLGGGWGATMKAAIRAWYADKPENELAYQMVKYVQRGGMSQRDVLRLCHFGKKADVRGDILNWVKSKGWDQIGHEAPCNDKVSLIPLWAAEAAKRATDEKEIVRLIEKYRLVRECIPSQWLNSVAVWDALLKDMPLTALIRNLGKMSAINLIYPLSEASLYIRRRLVDRMSLKAARIHPISLLGALRVYAQGHGERGKLKWQPNDVVMAAIEEAFYLAFDAVEPTNKRYLIGLDVSGSMASGNIAGFPGLTPREASCALSMVTVRTEPASHVVAFTSSGWNSQDGGRSGFGSVRGGLSNGLRDFDIRPGDRLDNVMDRASRLSFGGTDCSLPMQYALAKQIPVDVFLIITDNETWHNPQMHPCQALQKYRHLMGINAKLAVMAMTATQFSIADPNDPYQLDMVGLDTATPNVLANFAKS